MNNIDRYELQAEALRMIDADKYADKINELEASVRKPSSSLSTTATITRITPTGSTPVSTPTSRVLSPLPPQPLAITSELGYLADCLIKAPRDCSLGAFSYYGAICLA